jgi:hypothetical protein
MSQRPEGADAVLTLRSRVKANTALRTAAKAAGVPVYAIKSASTSNMIKAFRTLLGVEPSAGGFFAPSRGGSMDDYEGGASASGGLGRREVTSGGGGAAGSAPGGRGAFLFSSLDGGAGGSGSSGDEDEFGAALEDEEEDDDDVARAAEAAMLTRGGAWGGGSGSSIGGSSYASPEERDGLEEAQLAVEQIVMPLKQPVELLPRSEAVRGAQAAMARRYKLGVEVIGQGDDARLRILPAAAAAAAAVAEGGAAA